MEKNKFGVKHDDGHYSKMTGNDKNVSYSYMIKIRLFLVIRALILIIIPKPERVVL